MLVKRVFRKCWKVFIIDFVFIAHFDSSSNASNTFNRGFDSQIWKTKTIHVGAWKKINKWSYLAVNDLVKRLNYRIYTTHKKEKITPKFSTENLFGKSLLMTVQHEKNATRRKCSMKREEHKKSSVIIMQYEKKSNMKIVQHGKRATWKECNTKKVQHGNSKTWKECNP